MCSFLTKSAKQLFENSFLRVRGSSSPSLSSAATIHRFMSPGTSWSKEAKATNPSEKYQS